MNGVEIIGLDQHILAGIVDVPKENESENGTLNILPKKKTSQLPRKYVNFVRNTYKFEGYPWCRFAFDVLIASVHEIRNDLGNSSYLINCFIQGL